MNMNMETLIESTGLSREEIVEEAQWLGNSYRNTTAGEVLKSALMTAHPGAGFFHENSPITDGELICDRKIGHKHFYDKNGDSYELPYTGYENRAVYNRDIFVEGQKVCAQKRSWISGSWRPVECTD